MTFGLGLSHFSSSVKHLAVVVLVVVVLAVVEVVVVAAAVVVPVATELHFLGGLLCLPFLLCCFLLLACGFLCILCLLFCDRARLCSKALERALRPTVTVFVAVVSATCLRTELIALLLGTLTIT